MDQEQEETQNNLYSLFEKFIQTIHPQLSDTFDNSIFKKKILKKN